MQYTDDMRMELMRSARDPIYFIENYVMVRHPVDGIIKLKLYPFQKDYIRHLMTHGNVIAKMGRQQGKTIVTAAYLFWESVFKTNRTHMVVLQKFGMATDLMERFKCMYEWLPLFMRPALKYSNRTTMEFDNGVQLLTAVASDATGRGRTLSSLFLDEMAFWKPEQCDILEYMIPCLPTGGKMIIASTLAKDSGKFREMYANAVVGESLFTPFSASWDDMPGRDEAYKAHMRDLLGAERYKLECGVEFLNG